VSVNCTACPAAGEVGLATKEDLIATDADTLTVWLVLFPAELLATVRMTDLGPAAA